MCVCVPNLLSSKYLQLECFQNLSKWSQNLESFGVPWSSSVGSLPVRVWLPQPFFCAGLLKSMCCSPRAG